MLRWHNCTSSAYHSKTVATTGDFFNFLAGQQWQISRRLGKKLNNLLSNILCRIPAEPFAIFEAIFLFFWRHSLQSHRPLFSEGMNFLVSDSVTPSNSGGCQETWRKVTRGLRKRLEMAIFAIKQFSIAQYWTQYQKITTGNLQKLHTSPKIAAFVKIRVQFSIISSCVYPDITMVNLAQYHCRAQGSCVYTDIVRVDLSSVSLLNAVNHTILMFSFSWYLLTPFFQKTNYATWRNFHRKKGHQLDHFFIPRRDLPRISDAGIAKLRL